jgi:6-phosphogluconolactonase
MSTSLPDAELIVGADAVELTKTLASDVIDVLAGAIAEHGAANLAVSGGSLATVVVPAMVELGNARDLDWSHVHVWFVDERFVDRGTDERNATPVVAAMRHATDFPASQLHIAAGRDLGMSLAEAAAEYEQRLIRHVPVRESNGVPSLDLALLGMGPDGHTASLFPGRLPAETSALAVAVDDSPKPPPMRVTLTYRMLDAAARCWVFATGAEKHSALALARTGNASAEESPVSRVRARHEVRVYADAAATRQA